MKRRRLLGCIASIVAASTILAGCGNTEIETTSAQSAVSSSQAETTATEESPATSSSIEKAESNLSGTIRFLCGTDDAEAIKTTFAEFQKLYPNANLDEVIAQDVTDSETLMSTWIASGDFPDMCIQQTGSLQQSYMKDGYFAPLDDLGVMDRLVEGDTSLIQYNGKYYQFPLTSAISVTICNNGVLKDMGINLTVDNYPKDMDEFINLLQQTRDNGVQYPYGIAGADSSS